MDSHQDVMKESVNVSKHNSIFTSLFANSFSVCKHEDGHTSFFAKTTQLKQSWKLIVIARQKNSADEVIPAV